MAFVSPAAHAVVSVACAALAAFSFVSLCCCNVLPSNFPSSVPVASPSAQPTPHVDEFWDLTPQIKEDNNTQFFGCTTPGCSVSKTWRIQGVCEQLLVSVVVVETDFSMTSDTVQIYVNDEWIASCDQLEQNCTNTWTKCTDAHKRDITSFIDTKAFANFVSVTVDASESVDACPYESTQYLSGSITLTCTRFNTTWFPSMMPSAPTRAPTTSPTDPFDLVQNAIISTATRTYACAEGGCRVKRSFRIFGWCEQFILNVAVVETDFGFNHEIVDVLLDDVNIGSCDDLKADCTFDWVQCRNFTNLDVTHLVDGRGWETWIPVELDLSLDVNACPHEVGDSSYFLFANVSLTCVASDRAGYTTPAPTRPEIDFYMDVTETDSDSENEVVQDVREFGCETTGCELVRVWEVLQTEKTCGEVWLGVEVVNNDDVSVRVNDMHVSECQSVTTNCAELEQIQDFEHCVGSLDSLGSLGAMGEFGWNVTSLMQNNKNDASQWMQVEFASDSEETGCDYYLYARVTVTCVVAEEVATSDDDFNEFFITVAISIPCTIVAILCIIGLFVKMKHYWFKLDKIWFRSEKRPSVSNITSLKLKPGRSPTITPRAGSTGRMGESARAAAGVTGQQLIGRSAGSLPNVPAINVQGKKRDSVHRRLATLSVSSKSELRIHRDRSVSREASMSRSASPHVPLSPQRLTPRLAQADTQSFDSYDNEKSRTTISRSTANGETSLAEKTENPEFYD